MDGAKVTCTYGRNVQEVGHRKQNAQQAEPPPFDADDVVLAVEFEGEFGPVPPGDEGYRATSVIVIDRQGDAALVRTHLRVRVQNKLVRGLRMFTPGLRVICQLHTD